MRVHVCLFALLLASGAEAQTPRATEPPMQNDRASFTAKAHRALAPKAQEGAVIRGRVLAGDTGTPIPGALVTISGAASGVQRSVSTDREGRFEFAGLPADSYRLGALPGATRGQYLSLRYGGRDPMDAGERLDVVDGQRIERADIVLPRSAVIVGRVTDESGEPLARVPVYAMQLRGGAPVRLSNLQDATDDLGNFRLFGLMAGDYLVAAEVRPAVNAAVEGDTQGFVTTYHPGALSRAEALRVRVKAAEEAPADIRLVRSRLFRIAGSIVNRRGDPVRRATMFVTRREIVGYGAASMVTVDAQGRFTLANLAPGDYRVIVRDASPANEALAIKEYAAADVRLDQADVTDVMLVTGPGVTVQGRVVFEPAAPSQAAVRFSAGSPDRFSPMTGVAGAMPDEDTFVIPDVFGPALLRAEVTRPTGWFLKAVTLRGRDITDVPTEFTASDAGQVEIVLTSRPARLDGRVLDESGAAAGGNVVLFGEDPATWSIRGSSRLRVVGIRKDGRFAVEGLRPGTYLAVAVPRGQSINTFDPRRDVFEAFVADAVRVELREGERRSLVLRPLEVR